MHVILNLIGWAIVIFSIAFIVRDSRRKIPAKDAGIVGAHLRKADAHREDIDDLCDAIEVLTGSGAMIFDCSMKLVAIGEKGKGIVGRDEFARIHLVDIVPMDAAAPFLRGISAARREGVKTWKCSWNGKNISATAARAGEFCIVAVRSPPA